LLNKERHEMATQKQLAAIKRLSGGQEPEGPAKASY